MELCLVATIQQETVDKGGGPEALAVIPRSRDVATGKISGKVLQREFGMPACQLKFPPGLIPHSLPEEICKIKGVIPLISKHPLVPGTEQLLFQAVPDSKASHPIEVDRQSSPY